MIYGTIPLGVGHIRYPSCKKTEKDGMIFQKTTNQVLVVFY